MKTIEVPVSISTDTLQFLPLAVCPVCGDDLDIHERLDVVGMVPTSPEGEGSAEIVGCDRVDCRWFALCTNYATHTETHPVLRYVPACDRCPKIGH